MQSKTRGVMVLAVVLVALLLSACQAVNVPVAEVTCVSEFEATVHQGPSTGLALTGKMLFTVDSAGSLTGGLVTADGQEVKVAGQSNGRAISLLFNVGEEQYIFGDGVGENPIHRCSGVWGGGFTGPQAGDSGDWIGTGGTVVGGPIDIVEVVPIIEIIEVPPAEFVCGANYCQCEGTQDCTRLAESGVCKSGISFKDQAGNETNKGECLYRPLDQ